MQFWVPFLRDQSFVLTSPQNDSSLHNRQSDQMIVTFGLVIAKSAHGTVNSRPVGQWTTV
jgi:hypothetical protein